MIVPVPYEIIALVVLLIFLALAVVIYLLRKVTNKEREAAEINRVFVNSSPFVVNIWDDAFKLVSTSKQSIKIFGVSSQEEYMERFFELSPEYQPCGASSREKALDYVKQTFAEGKTRFEWMHQTLTKELVPMEITMERFMRNGKYHLMSFAADLRPIKAAVEKENEKITRKRLQAMLDSSPLSCYILSEKFDVIELNQETLNLFKLETRQEFIDNFFALVPEHQPDGCLSIQKMNNLMSEVLEKGRIHFEWRGKDKNGDEIPCEIHASSVTIDGTKSAIIHVRDLRDIQNAIAMNERLASLAYTDNLTQINNREFFLQTAEKALLNCIEKDFSIIIFDIDHFKQVNDTHGHIVGDEVLKAIAARAKKVIRATTLIARYGGEEFVLMFPGTIKNAEKTALRIKEQFSGYPFCINDLSLNITASFGVASKSHGCHTLLEILDNADKALYHAKNAGRNAVAVYEAGKITLSLDAGKTACKKINKLSLHGGVVD